MSSLQSYYTNINTLVYNEDSEKLTKLLRLPIKSNGAIDISPSIKSLATQFKQSNADHQNNNSSISKIVTSSGLALIALVNNDLETTYKQTIITYNLTTDFFSSNDDNNTTWIIPLFVAISNDLRIIAEIVDKSKNDSELPTLRDSTNYLTKGFTVAAKDRSAITTGKSKRLAIFGVSNVLFKVYFKMQTIQLCQKLINVIEEPKSGIMENITYFSVSDVVMYKYYVGRLKLFEDKFQEARDCFYFALKYTPKTCLANRQRILTSLIPLEINNGIMPSSIITREYNLPELVELGETVKKGDIAKFDSIMNQHQKSFIKIGIYLVLEQAKNIAYRSLFKRIYKIMENTRLNLNSMEYIMNKLGEEVDVDELECIIANLIYQNKIKGYMSHEKRFLVLSKNDPFPITSVIKRIKL